MKFYKQRVGIHSPFNCQNRIAMKTQGFKRWCKDQWFNLSQKVKGILPKKKSTNSYQFSIAVPGFSRKDLNIEIKDDRLYIWSNKSRDETFDNGWFKQRIYQNISFRKAVKLPKNCQIDEIKAKYNDGILNISIPYTNENAKRIKVM